MFNISEWFKIYLSSFQVLHFLALYDCTVYLLLVEMLGMGQYEKKYRMFFIISQNSIKILLKKFHLK